MLRYGLCLLLLPMTVSCNTATIPVQANNTILSQSRLVPGMYTGETATTLTLTFSGETITSTDTYNDTVTIGENGIPFSVLGKEFAVGDVISGHYGDAIEASSTVTSVTVSADGVTTRANTSAVFMTQSSTQSLSLPMTGYATNTCIFRDAKTVIATFELTMAGNLTDYGTILLVYSESGTLTKP